MLILFELCTNEPINVKLTSKIDSKRMTTLLFPFFLISHFMCFEIEDIRY